MVERAAAFCAPMMVFRQLELDAHFAVRRIERQHAGESFQRAPEHVAHFQQMAELLERFGIGWIKPGSLPIGRFGRCQVPTLLARVAQLNPDGLQ